ncbi:hypothetical protein [Tepidiforma thermophila]|uniref:Uncharacterized protein n=1 Tax=Tepidiforma thermophila (strain KCTC 52669 / CGMCC 1.13589 / G233) TaxID=2761530 RepID=A0A2A9HCQ5_TEPT2|nr:hypothetical protein [Tepidiforma thermophila]PFG73548.1 hypothetical protein A9A59_0748 [Tepidiforma thermophila]
MAQRHDLRPGTADAIRRSPREICRVYILHHAGLEPPGDDAADAVIFSDGGCQTPALFWSDWRSWAVQCDCPIESFVVLVYPAPGYEAFALEVREWCNGLPP